MVAGKHILLASCLLGLCSAWAVSLESTDLRIDFGDDHFAVRRIESRSSGAVFCAADSSDPAFWELTFWKDGVGSVRHVLTERSKCRNRRVEWLPGGGRAFIWEDISLPEERNGVSVRATVRLTPDGASEWTLSVANSSTAWALAETRYPILRGVTADGGSDVLLPRADTGARLVRSKRYDQAYEFGCLGYFPMMTAFFCGESGLYIAAHDPQARIKTLSISKAHDVSFVTPVENAGRVGLAAEGPRYSVTIAALNGSWWSAAERYRAWALSAPWTAKGRVIDRKDYPRHIAEIPIWINTHAYPQEVSNTMLRAKASFPNHDVGLHWHLWQHSGHDINYPEYFPEQPGTKECLSFCHFIGAEVMPYTNGRLWSTNLVSYLLVKHAALTKADGSPYVETYGKKTPPMSPMCPYTTEWAAVIADIADRVWSLGASSLFLDQVGASEGRCCFNCKHGHPVGGGTWYFDGYQALLGKVHAVSAPKEAFLAVEGSGEQWMNVVDGYLQVTQRQPDDVPFFHAVYSGYTTYFCSPENHEDDVDSFWAAQARELLWGQSLGWYHPLILDDAEKCALIRRLTEFRQDNLDCFAYGVLEGEIDFTETIPMQTVRWLGRKQFYDWKDKGAPLSPTIFGELPSVIGYVWRSSKSNRQVAFLANLSMDDRLALFSFCGRKYRVKLTARQLARFDSQQVPCEVKVGE